MTCSQGQTHPIATRRILIVEDEAIVALNYASILEDAGCQIIGPVGTIQKGIEAVENERIDGAVLDIDIGGVLVDPIIMALRRKRLPYIFVSALSGLVGRYQDAAFLDKPCTATELIRAVSALVPQAPNRQDDFNPAA
jgi:DNA-binding response OmpR family regulator